MTSPIHEQLRQILADVFEVSTEHVTEESSPDNIETWDSLRHLNLVLALEEHFVVQFEPEEIEELVSFDLIQKMIETKNGVNGTGHGS